MMIEQIEKRPESGSTLLEFTFVAVTFFMMLLAITSGANFYFTHNALVEATRRGARFAATQAASSPAGTITACPATNVGPSVTAIRNYAIYGNAAGTGPKLIANLQPANISVEYCNFGVGTGSVSVSITGYNYSVVIPFISRQITMPANRTTMRGESAGTLPTPACGP
jgi:Flp pilus assembly protein TadG